MTSNEEQRSKDHEADALTHLESATTGALSIGADAATSTDLGRDSQVARALVVFLGSAVPALVHAQLSQAAATRELAGVVEDLRRMIP